MLTILSSDVAGLNLNCIPHNSSHTSPVIAWLIHVVGNQIRLPLTLGLTIVVFNICTDVKVHT